MRKIFVFVLLFAYTTLACGVNVRLHYCGGKLQNISFFGKAHEDCCKKKMKKKNCCSNKTNFLKVKDKHNSNISHSSFKNNASEIYSTTFTYRFHPKSPDEFITDHHFPPVLYDNPIYLKNRVLII